MKSFIPKATRAALIFEPAIDIQTRGRGALVGRPDNAFGFDILFWNGNLLFTSSEQVNCRHAIFCAFTTVMLT